MSITILTPTFNRAYTLSRLFQSLLMQGGSDFEWLIIDDGSTDKTYDLVQSFIEKANFEVRYFYKDNGGKHSALNHGIFKARKHWIFIVDSDDYLSQSALEIVSSKIRNLDTDIIGLCFRKSHSNGEIIGIDLLNQMRYFRPFEAGRYYKGDLAYVFRKGAMINNLFPIFEGEKFVPELVVWNKISDHGKILYFSGISIYICEYLSDGYSANFNSNIRSNPKGFAFHYWDAFVREKNILFKIKNLIRYLQCRRYILLKA